MGMQAEPSGLPTEQVRALEEEVDADMPPLPPKLLNNAGVLHLRLGDTSTGTALFQEALKVLPSLPASHMSQHPVLGRGHSYERTSNAPNEQADRGLTVDDAGLVHY